MIFNRYPRKRKFECGQPRRGGWLSHQELFEKGDENFVGDGEAGGRETKQLAIKFDYALLAESLDAGANCGDAIALAIGGVIAFDADEIDPFKLAEAEEEFFFEGLKGRD